MNDYLQMLSAPIMIRLGWALIHFLWQALLIALALKIALAWVGRKQASANYLLCALALAAMPVCLAATFAVVGAGPDIPKARPVSVPAANVVEATPQAAPAGLASPTATNTLVGFPSREIPSLDLNRFMPVVVGIWLLGVVVLSGRKAGGFLVLWRLRRRGVSAPTDAMMEIFRKACGRIGVDPRRVCLKISSLIQVPMTMGWISPIILFPAALLTGLSTGEIELLLAHELAHIRRSDYFVNLLQTVIETLFFYHPVTWWISRRMMQERENCCDDLVVARSTETLAYAKVLVRLETLRPTESALATAANGGNLLQRVERLIGNPAVSSTTGLPSLLALFCILGLLTASATTLVRAQATSTSKPRVTMTVEEAKRKGIVALVNGTPVPLPEYAKRLLSMDFLQLKKNFSGSELTRKTAEFHEMLLKGVVDRRLMIDDFKANGGFIPPTHADDRVDDIVRDVYRGDRAAFLKELADRDITLEKYEEGVEDNAIIGCEMNKNVTAKLFDYYQDHIDLFPEDERINVTIIKIPDDFKAPVWDHEHNSMYIVAREILDQLSKGADFSALAKKYNSANHENVSDRGDTVWLTNNRPANWLPDNATGWQALEKVGPGQMSGVLEGVDFCAIARVNRRLSATMYSTDEVKRQREMLLNEEGARIREVWLDGLRAKAQIQTFEITDANLNGASSPGSAVQAASYQPVPAAVIAAALAEVGGQETQQSQPTSIPVAKAVPATPEAVFALPITVKEAKEHVGDFIERSYFQGGNLILQQNTNVSRGIVGQLIYYKNKVVVDDRVITKTVPLSWREVHTDDLKISVQSLAADSISPASLRILDSSQEIISEFFIDKSGVMRPVTKAEHDANITLRTEKLTPILAAAATQTQATNAPDKNFDVQPDTESGRALVAKLKSIVIDKVNFNQVDVATILQFLTQKSAELDLEKKGIQFVLGDLSHVAPSDRIHREVTIAIENTPLDDLLGYVTQQTNLKCSIEGDTIVLKP